MARRPSAKTKAKLPKSRVPQPFLSAVHWFCSLRLFAQIAVAAVVVCGAWFVMHTISREITFLHQKPKYAALERHMQQVMNEITTATGKPLEINHGTGCSRTSAKFDEGLLNCNNFYYFSYEIDSEEEGRTLISKIVPVYSTESIGNDFMFPSSISEVDTMFSLSHNYLDKFSCDLDYSLTKKAVHNDTLGRNYKKPVSKLYAAEFSYACGGYPVKSVYKFYN